MEDTSHARARIGKLQESFESEDSERSDKVRSCFIPVNDMSFRPKGMSFLRNIYSSTNEIPAYYTEQKRVEYMGQLKYTYILRKIAGFPFAVGYTFLLLWIISNFIVPNANVAYYSKENVITPKDVCAELQTTINSTKEHVLEKKYNIKYTSDNTSKSIPNMTNPSTKGATEERRILFDNVPTPLYYSTCTFMSIVGVFSFFSRNTRTTMFLILPGLATKHSRNVIFTIVLGIISNGPWNNIQYNIDKLFKNGACMYRAAMVLACGKEKQLREVVNDAKDIYENLLDLQRKLQKMICSSCPEMPYKPYKYANSTWGSVSSMAATSSDTIKEQVYIVLLRIRSLGIYVEIARKCLTMLSIIWLIFDAVRYLRSYYTDSSFDNMYIEGSIPRYWKGKRYRKVIPLRHWEIKEGYSASHRPSVKRKSKLLRKMFVTFVFILFVIVILLVDNVIAVAIKYIKENEKFHVSFNDARQNRTGDASFKFEAYNTKSCLSDPKYTIPEDYWKISLLLLAAIASGVFEVYASRLRARMCNLFYPDKAEERADFLFYRIYSGRIIRRYQMLMIVRREMERRIKLARFSPLKKFEKYLSRACGHRKRHIICPGCGLKMKLSYAKKVFFGVQRNHHDPGSIKSKITIFERISKDQEIGTIDSDIYSEKQEKELSALVCEDCEYDLAIGKEKLDDDLMDIYESHETLGEKTPPN